MHGTNDSYLGVFVIHITHMTSFLVNFKAFSKTGENFRKFHFLEVA